MRTLSLLLLVASPAVAQKVEPHGPPNEWPAQGEDHYPNYRDQVRRAPFVVLPAPAVVPGGWLKNELAIHAAGAGKAKPDAEWLRGAGDLARLSGDAALLAKATAELKAALKTWADPVATMDAAAAHCDAAADRAVLDALLKHALKLAATADDRALLAAVRGDPVDLYPPLFWLHARTGRGELIDLADRLRKLGPTWALGVPELGTTDLARGFRGPLHAWQFTGRQRYRDRTDRGYDMLAEACGRFPGGGFVRGDPKAPPPADDARAAVPAAAAVELLHSHLLMARATGDTKWLDRAEEIAFDTLPALTLPDGSWVESTAANAIAAKPGPALVRAWPLVARHAVAATSDNGLAVLLPVPTTVKAKAGTGDVTVDVVTDYPFGDSVEVRVTCAEANDFPLYLRAPYWADNCRLTTARKGHKIDAGQYAKLTAWPKGTTAVTLAFNPGVRVTGWDEHRGCVSIGRGPLTFGVNVPAAGPWNYALLYADADPADSFTVDRRPVPTTGGAFTAKEAPLALSVLARRVPGWKADGDRPGALQDGWARTTEPVETLRLVPMGAARLRMTVLPRASDAADTREWR